MQFNVLWIVILFTTYKITNQDGASTIIIFSNTNITWTTRHYYDFLRVTQQVCVIIQMWFFCLFSHNNIMNTTLNTKDKTNFLFASCLRTLFTTTLVQRACFLLFNCITQSIIINTLYDNTINFTRIIQMCTISLKEHQ